MLCSHGHDYIRYSIFRNIYYIVCFVTVMVSITTGSNIKVDVNVQELEKRPTRNLLSHVIICPDHTADATLRHSTLCLQWYPIMLIKT
jgi:hypothetical protein